MLKKHMDDDPRLFSPDIVLSLLLCYRDIQVCKGTSALVLSRFATFNSSLCLLYALLLVPPANLVNISKSSH